MSGMTRREALMVGGGLAVSLLAATGLADLTSVTGGSYRGVHYRVLADRLELNGVPVDAMAFDRIGDRYVSHLLCYSDSRDPITLVRGLIDGRHDRLFDC
jgi:hypothetical protein